MYIHTYPHKQPKTYIALGLSCCVYWILPSTSAEHICNWVGISSNTFLLTFPIFHLWKNKYTHSESDPRRKHILYVYTYVYFDVKYIFFSVFSWLCREAYCTYLIRLSRKISPNYNIQPRSNVFTVHPIVTELLCFCIPIVIM